MVFNVSDDKKIAELEAQVEELKTSRLMALADLDNYRKRSEKEKMELRTMANLSILHSIMDLVDDFSRMISDLDKPGEDYTDAYKTIMDKAKGIILDQGLEEIRVEKGEKFDHNTMEAIGSVVTEVEADNGTVHDVTQLGYKYSSKDLVVRHAKVIVNKFTQA